jgi:hypothetical protein
LGLEKIRRGIPVWTAARNAEGHRSGLEVQFQ